MLNIRKRVTALGRIAALLSCLFATLVHAQTFTFTAIPDQDETRLMQRFTKVADYLSKTLGIKVKYIPVKSYPAAITAFRNNQVQLAWFGGLSGVQARHLVPGSEALAQGAEDAAFISYFIVNTRTGIKPSDTFPAAIAGKTFTFGSKGSTSGRLMPEYYIRKYLHKAPDKVFSRVGFSGDHTRTIALVQSGAYDVGVLNYEVWNSEVKQGLIDPKKVRVVWQTPPFPDYQWSIRGDVDATWGKGFKEKVRKALLDMKDPNLLKAFPRSKFIPASNSDYAPVKKTAIDLGIMDAS